MSAVKKFQAKRSVWITIAAVFLIFQAAGALLGKLSLVYWIATVIIPDGYLSLSDIVLYFIPPLITTIVFVGAPLYLTYRVFKNDASTATLSYILIAAFVFQFIFEVIFQRLIGSVPFPYPTAGLEGFWGLISFLTGVTYETWGNTFNDVATLTNFAYLVSGIGLLSVTPVKKAAALAPMPTTSSSKLSPSTGHVFAP